MSCFAASTRTVTISDFRVLAIRKSYSLGTLIAKKLSLSLLKLTFSILCTENSPQATYSDVSGAGGHPSKQQKDNVEKWERAKACLQGDSVLEAIERGIQNVNCNVGDNEHAAHQRTLAIDLHNIVGEQNLRVPCTATA